MNTFTMCVSVSKNCKQHAESTAGQDSVPRISAGVYHRGSGEGTSSSLAVGTWKCMPPPAWERLGGTVNVAVCENGHDSGVDGERDASDIVGLEALEISRSL
jgi:hypothetical protein